MFNARGYTLKNGVRNSITGDCLSHVLPGVVLTYASTSESNSNSWRLTSVTLSESSTVGAIAVVGWNVKRAVANTTTTSSTIFSTSTSSAAVSSQTPSIPSPTPTTTPSTTPSSSLSSGAKTGIGVGAALGTIGLIALMAAIWLFRRGKRKSASQGTVAMNGNYPTRSTDAAWMLHNQKPSELDSRPLPAVELDAGRNP